MCEFFRSVVIFCGKAKSVSCPLSYGGKLAYGELSSYLLKFSRSDLASWRGFSQRAEISELDQSPRRNKINSGKIGKFELFHAERTNMGTAFQALLMCFVSCPQQADLALLQDPPKVLNCHEQDILLPPTPRYTHIYPVQT